jgi:polyisoprenoid-binding protein YceI
MTTRYRFDPDHSRFTVQAFAAGLLSFLGHSPTFSVRSLGGTLEFPDDLVAKLRLELSIAANSLVAGEDVKPADRREIEDRMRAEVLETTKFPEITFRAVAAGADKLAEGRYRVTLDGTLNVHGVQRPHRLTGELGLLTDGARLAGETGVRMSEFRIRPVTALGGTIRLKDELKLTFDLAAVPETS